MLKHIQTNQISYYEETGDTKTNVYFLEELDTVSQVQISEEAICISFSRLYLCKRHESIYSPSLAIGN